MVFEIKRKKKVERNVEIKQCFYSYFHLDFHFNLLNLAQNAALQSGVVLRLEQYVEKHICFNRVLQGTAQFSHRAALKTFLHLPVLQHLVDLLSQTVTWIVVLDGVNLHLGEAQLPGAGFPLSTYVLADQLQMFISYGMVFYTRTRTTTTTIWMFTVGC